MAGDILCHWQRQAGNEAACRSMIPISGQKLFVEPGKICLTEDLAGQRHAFRVAGSQEWVALFVDFAR